MKICVCVKHVPDPNFPMVVDPASKRLQRDAAQSILDPADEYGVETALKLVEEHGGEVVAITMGPAASDDALRRAMAMGVERVIQVTDDALAGSDALGTARVLAETIRSENPDLVITAIESTDSYSGMVPGALAELLGLPQVTFARSAEVSGNTLRVTRDIETGRQTLEVTLPALLSVTASIAEPRYPSFRGLMQAKRKPVDLKALSDLGIDPSTVGEAGAKERVLSIEKDVQEKQGRKIEDDGSGDSVDQIIAYLKEIQVV
jgi:electron transfer flavoprotein beta subunit